MKQSPDDRFRRRLKDHSLTPPAEVWSRIESNLPARRRHIWIKAAAAVLLLFTATALIFLMRDNNGTQPIAEDHILTETQPQPPATGSPTNAASDDHIIPSEETLTTAEAPPVKQETPVNRIPTAKEVLDDHLNNSIAEVPRSVPDEAETTLLTPDTDADTAPLTADAVMNADTPFKLILEVNEVQSKYLRKKSVAHATEEDAQPSGLKRLLDKANEISNQDHIGDLRQMKNEIFALNFQGKKRDQHK